MKIQMMTTLVAALLISFLGVQSAEAGKRCGLGSKIFGKSKSISSQVSEMITNPLFSGGASGSYGTSGCKHNGNLIYEGIGQNDRQEEQAIYANANFEELQIEMASGSGPTLSAFAETFGCQGDGVGAFGEMTRKNYPQIMESQGTSPDQMLIRVRESFSKDTQVRRLCGEA